MNLVIMGPQGSGKGTQAKLLVKKWDYQYFESGDILREKAREKSRLGRQINKIIHQKGSLVSDRIMARIVSKWLEKVEIKKGMIFDGFPRNISQFRLLEESLTKRGIKIDKVILLEISRDVSIQRLSGRRICPRCGLEYNLVTKPPKSDELCDRCGVKLTQRQDDTPEVIESRLEIYQKKTQSLVDFIQKKGILEKVDGERPIEVIYQDIKKRLNR